MTVDPHLVSVVTPCWNAAPFVAETIRSVAAQTYPAVEHIVVDDGSTDESWAIVQQSGPSVVGVRLTGNHGGSYARNRGAERARGAYLMFLDADDLIAPDTLAALVAAVRERPRAIAACPWRRLRWAHGRWIDAPAEVPFPPPPDALRGWLERIWVPPCALLWRRDTYELVGGWNERMTLNDDGDLAMRALARGATIVPTRAGLAHYRHHGASRLSLSQDTFTERRIRSVCIGLENLTAELQAQGTLDAYREPIGLVYHRLAQLCFCHGMRELARGCLTRGEALAGRQVVAKTWPGRILTRLVGLERKERVAEALAKVGVMTRLRRQQSRLRALSRRDSDRRAG